MIYTKRINKDQNFNELQLHLVRFLTFSIQINNHAGTRKTVINTLKTIRKQIDESLKYFCGGSGISDPGYPKIFFFRRDHGIYLL